jgi:hypothetical protein
MKYYYYYNDVPGEGLSRNNLIYTSLMSEDNTTFVQWYHNDTTYHAGQNQVIDPALMQEKFEREIKYLTLMYKKFPQHVPEIKDIDYNEKKIYLLVDGKDFWNRANCTTKNYDSVLPDWQEQIKEIVSAHRSLGLWKYSMHPSSFFVVGEKLKSINYFFTYEAKESNISIRDVESHIYSTRQEELKKYLTPLGIDWNTPQSWEILNTLCWESFRTNYPNNFIEDVKCIN